MHKRIFTLFFLFLFVYVSTAEAQRWRSHRFLSYVGVGTANVYGDIGGSLTQENLYGIKDFDIEFTRPSIAAGAKYRINHRFNARVNFAAAYLQGSDKNALNEDVRYGGGYQFSSLIFEPSAMAEFYIIPESRSMVSEAIYNRKGMVNTFRSIHLYAFAGAGGLVIRPNVTYMKDDPEMGIKAGDPVYDDGFQTADYEHKDTRFGVAIPFGIGAQMDLTVYWTIHLELGRRYTLTDYVDGYTSRISTSSDVYDFLNVIFCYKIKTDKDGIPVIFGKRSKLF